MEKKEEPVYTHCNKDLNVKVSELMDDFNTLVSKAKGYGLDIRLFTGSDTLVLYFNDDYPDTLLVDKNLSSLKREAEWVPSTIGDDIQSLYPAVTCSACGCTNGMMVTPYCPHCGRKMTNALREEADHD